ncbi:diguanylate cyclase [Maridesulfovibrio sp. FT414]|uniref:sensor domain-containing diguanylate cyclase n=1 Tax=Maridesulfovibrio sp. FT414 TaxID=2979469 RepID=UPI003D807B4D
MNNFPDTETILEEFHALKQTHEDLKRHVLEKCPECGQTRFRTLFDHAGSAIAVLDGEGKILLTNAAFSDITGYTQSETAGSPLHIFLVARHDLDGQEYLQNLFCTPDAKSSLSLSILDKQQEIRFVDLTVANVTICDSGLRNCICIFNDVTSERENELRREELIEELMEAKELQEDNAAQLAMLLHELDMKNLELEKEVAERKRAEEKLRESEERFKNMSITDQLTGLYNRRHMIEVAIREVEACNRVDRPLSLILMDLDDFKKYNDTYGHAAGDVVLERVGRVIKETIRYTDQAFRYGGEEFLIILPGTDGGKATQVAEAIRKAVARECYYPKGDMPVRKTMSIGVSQYIPGEPLENVLKRADDNMYKSKIRGKNKVYFACETGESSFV